MTLSLELTVTVFVTLFPMKVTPAPEIVTSFLKVLFSTTAPAPLIVALASKVLP